MRRSIWALFKRNTSGAVAPTVALSLFALVAAGGIAFDYARLASMDTELQQSADQAALAAATQLDRSDGAQARAERAIQDPDDTHRLAANYTRFANDGNGTPVEIENVQFCSAFDDTVQDTDAACTAATGDDDSLFVIVTTQVRTADYAFTPIVAAFSGSSSAKAVAGVASSICNVAPLLVCAPNDDFPTEADVGKGVVMKVAGGNQWVPGNYGYLDFGNGNQAVLDALMGFGLNGCQSTQSTQTEPGNKNATDAINTRMDVYGGTGATKNPSVCDPTTGSGCPAANTRKDMTMTMTYVLKQDTSLGQPASSGSCTSPATANNANPSVTYNSSWTNTTSQTHLAGFNRDLCHYSANGCPGGNFGDKDWDRAGYLATNHPGVTASQIAAAIQSTFPDATAATLTRYQVYTWEQQTAGALDPIQVGPTNISSKAQGSKTTWTFTRQCSFPTPKLATTSYPAQKDRRILPVVAADCTNLKGKGSAFVDFKILRVFDVFLTEPSLSRSMTDVGGAQGTDDKEIYGEVIGPAETFAGSNGFQYYSRSKPYLVR